MLLFRSISKYFCSFLRFNFTIEWKGWIKQTCTIKNPNRIHLIRQNTCTISVVFAPISFSSILMQMPGLEFPPAPLESLLQLLQPDGGQLLLPPPLNVLLVPLAELHLSSATQRRRSQPLSETKKDPNLGLIKKRNNMVIELSRGGSRSAHIRNKSGGRSMCKPEIHILFHFLLLLLLLPTLVFAGQSMWCQDKKENGLLVCVLISRDGELESCPSYTGLAQSATRHLYSVSVWQNAEALVKFLRGMWKWWNICVLHISHCEDWR